MVQPFLPGEETPAVLSHCKSLRITQCHMGQSFIRQLQIRVLLPFLTDEFLLSSNYPRQETHEPEAETKSTCSLRTLFLQWSESWYFSCGQWVWFFIPAIMHFLAQPYSHTAPFPCTVIPHVCQDSETVEVNGFVRIVNEISFPLKVQVKNHIYWKICFTMDLVSSWTCTLLNQHHHLALLYKIFLGRDDNSQKQDYAFTAETPFYF